LLLGQTRAATAEAVMRARYTAYSLAEIDYLYASSGPRVRAEFDAESSRKWAQSAEWKGFTILQSEGGGAQDDRGVIEFVAHYRIEQADYEHHEIATFGRVEGEWRFQDGRMVNPPPERREVPKIGRNDPCTCGSGKKYKKCCGQAGAERSEPAHAQG
jgi:SEC-C motif-containing protein